MNAKEKHDLSRKPLTNEDLVLLKERIDAGRLLLIKRAPIRCGSCIDGEMTMRFIGHIDEVSELEYVCIKCGQKYYG